MSGGRGSGQMSYFAFKQWTRRSTNWGSIDRAAASVTADLTFRLSSTSAPLSRDDTVVTTSAELS